MEHGCLDEGEGGFAYRQGVARLDVDEVPVLVIVPADNGFAFLGAVDGCIGDFTHQLGQGTAVVHLVVIHDDVVNLLKVYLLLQTADKFAVVGLPDGVNQHDFFVANKIGIIT